VSREGLQRIAATLSARQGWDFSPVRERRDPVPWDYVEVVHRYLRPTDRVLDVGTGGGEKLLSLAPCFGTGTGIDASSEMIETALEHQASASISNVSFDVMRAEDLHFSDNAFDVVVNRHCTVDAGECYRVLRPGGFFITQQVGPRNTRNICALFGCGPGGQYEQDTTQNLLVLAEAFRALGGCVICSAEYDVRYWFLDVASLLFWHQAVPIPEDFDLELHWAQVDQVIADFSTPQGIETNEQRDLLIVQKG
jgi:SAM-dependent methyltransferase